MLLISQWFFLWDNASVYKFKLHLKLFSQSLMSCSFQSHVYQISVHLSMCFHCCVETFATFSIKSWGIWMGNFSFLQQSLYLFILYTYKIYFWLKKTSSQICKDFHLTKILDRHLLMNRSIQYGRYIALVRLVYVCSICDACLFF